MKEFVNSLKKFWNNRSPAAKTVLATAGVITLGAAAGGGAAAAVVGQAALSGLCAGFFITLLFGSRRSLLAGPVVGAAIGLISLAATCNATSNSTLKKTIQVEFNQRTSAQTEKADLRKETASTSALRFKAR